MRKDCTTLRWSESLMASTQPTVSPTFPTPVTTYVDTTSLESMRLLPLSWRPGTREAQAVIRDSCRSLTSRGTKYKHGTTTSCTIKMKRFTSWE